MDAGKNRNWQEYETPLEGTSKNSKWQKWETPPNKMGTSKNYHICALIIPGTVNEVESKTCKFGSIFLPIVPTSSAKNRGLPMTCSPVFAEEREKDPIKGVQHLCITWGTPLVARPLPGDVHGISFAWEMAGKQKRQTRRFDGKLRRFWRKSGAVWISFQSVLFLDNLKQLTTSKSAKPPRGVLRRLHDWCNFRADHPGSTSRGHIDERSRTAPGQIWADMVSRVSQS